VFVPVRYVYPSRTEAFQVPTLVLTAIWLVTYALLVAELPHPNRFVLAVSLGYVVYYVALSGYLTAIGARRRRAQSGQGVQRG
jgi:phosphatidylcholine synthase